MGKHMEDALRKSADMLVQRLREETARAQAAEALLDEMRETVKGHDSNFYDEQESYDRLCTILERSK